MSEFSHIGSDRGRRRAYHAILLKQAAQQRRLCGAALRAERGDRRNIFSPAATAYCDARRAIETAAAVRLGY